MSSPQLKKNGIEVEVWFEEERLIPEEDGYLGEELRFKREMVKKVAYFELKCFVEKRENLMPKCISVDGNKNVVLMKDRSKDSSVALFSIKILVKRDDYGILTTEYPLNNLRVLIFGKEGKFEVWEIAVIAQDGLFFLTEQITYEAQCFLNEAGEIVCPRLEKWPQLIELLKSLVKEEEILSVSEYSSSPIPKAEGLPPKQAKVVWWNFAQGLGAIVIDKKGTQARVHWRDLVIDQKGKLRALSPDQVVSYQKLVLPRQSKGRTTGFLMEAIGVTPITPTERNKG